MDKTDATKLKVHGIVARETLLAGGTNIGDHYKRLGDIFLSLANNLLYIISGLVEAEKCLENKNEAQARVVLLGIKQSVALVAGDILAIKKEKLETHIARRDMAAIEHLTDLCKSYKRLVDTFK